MMSNDWNGSFAGTDLQQRITDIIGAERGSFELSEATDDDVAMMMVVQMTIRYIVLLYYLRRCPLCM